MVAQAVDNAKANGIAYFASAGNRARQSWEGNFNLSAAEPGFHNFSFLSGEDTTQTVVNVPNGAFLECRCSGTSRGDRPSPTSTSSLVNATTGAALASDTTDNIQTGIPSADASWSNNTGATVPVGLRLLRFAGDRLPFMKYIARGNFGTFSIAQWDTASDTINPDAASAGGSLTVAAIAQNEPGLNDPEPYSSRGLAFRLFDKNGAPLPANAQFRQKPQLAGADAVSTSVPGFQPFGGTSAATPSAAGVAALVKSAKPSMSLGSWR